MSYKLILAIPALAACAGLASNYVKNKNFSDQIGASAPSQDMVQKTHVKETRGRFEVKDKYGEYTYTLSPKQEILDITVAASMPNQPGQESGSIAMLHYLDGDGTRKFERSFKNSASCPAPFFNRNAHQKTLFATDPALQKKIERWENDKWKDTGKWQTTKFSGRCITGTSRFIRRGTDLTDRVQSSTFSGCKMFYVEKIISRDPYLNKA